MTNEEFAKQVERVRIKLYKTALTYLGSEAMAVDAVDEAVYKALCGKWKLRQPEFFLCSFFHLKFSKQFRQFYVT